MASSVVSSWVGAGVDIIVVAVVVIVYYCGVGGRRNEMIAARSEIIVPPPVAINRFIIFVFYSHVIQHALLCMSLYPDGTPLSKSHHVDTFTPNWVF